MKEELCFKQNETFMELNLDFWTDQHDCLFSYCFESNTTHAVISKIWQGPI